MMKQRLYSIYRPEATVNRQISLVIGGEVLSANRHTEIPVYGGFWWAGKSNRAKLRNRTQTGFALKSNASLGVFTWVLSA